jgi:putative endonuclease
MIATPVYWQVYLLECRSGALYCGVTPHIARRFAAHQSGRGGRFTRSDPPVRVAFLQAVGTHGDALRREIAIKAMPAKDKRILAAAWSDKGCHDDLKLGGAIAAAQYFVELRWAERQAERLSRLQSQYQIEPESSPASSLAGPAPQDLAGACKFASMFAQRLFGGGLRGNVDHQYLQRDDGRIIDLCALANDVAEIRSKGRDPYRHDRRWFGNAEHKASLRSCDERVDAWVAAWRAAGGTIFVPETSTAAPQSSSDTPAARPRRARPG